MTLVTRIATVLTLGLGLLTGCTSSETHRFFIDADGGVHEIPGSKSGAITSQGGSLKVDDPNSPVFGAEIDVPAGAVGKDTTLTIGPASNPPAPPFGVRTLGPVVAFGPATLRYSVPVTVKLPYNIDALSTERLVILRLAGAADNSVSTRALHPNAAGNPPSWDVLAGNATGDMSRRLQALTDTNGLYVVAAANQSVILPGQDGGPGGSDGGVNPIDVVLGGGDGGPTQFDNQPPTFAGLVSAELNADGASAHLLWDAASDNLTSAAQIRYRIYLPSFATIGAPQGETAPGATSIDLPVSRGISYYFLVRAVDKAGNADSNLKILSLYVPPDGQVLKQLGQTCQASTECQSNSCSDGVCCENSCTGACLACNNAGARAGRCDPAPVGTDPRAACSTLSHPTGTNLLCDSAQQCTLCQPVGSTEICNDGVDNNGDQLIDGQDPACQVCGALPPIPFCNTVPPRVTLPDTSVSFPVQATSAVYDPLSGLLGIATNDQRDDGSAPLPYLQLVDLVSGAAQSTVQLDPDTSFSQSLANPQVALVGGVFATTFALDNMDSNAVPQYFSSVTSSGTLTGPNSLGEARTTPGETALASFSGNKLAHVYPVFDTATETASMQLQVLDQSGNTVGNPIVLESAASPNPIQGNACMGNGDCSGPTPICDVNNTGVCVGCLSDQDCTGGLACDSNKRLCAGLTPIARAAVIDTGTDLAIAWPAQLGSNAVIRLARLGYTATSPSSVVNVTDANGLVAQPNQAPVALAVNQTSLLVTFAGFASQQLAQQTQLYDLQTRMPVGLTNPIGVNFEFPSGSAAVTSGFAGGGFLLAWGGSDKFSTTVISRLDPSAKEISSFKVHATFDAVAALEPSLGNYAVVANSSGQPNNTPLVIPVCAPTFPQTNATCASALPMGIGDTVTGNMSAVSATGFGACGGNLKNVYYKVTVPAQFSANLTLSPQNGASSLITVANDCAAATCVNMSQRGAGQDNFLTIDAVAGQATYIVGVQTDGGDFSFNVSLGSGGF